ncbi:protein of unknown function [Propionivibrio dicarboxylicus]|uniref:DUF4390 domain-containing protein n=2 Tax=Propionivibrio dicarboxylicus TaxID=83767 RepID=A0A1G7WA12_9RHOO|nr:protein of unknown function [Propionivibrio dicarboxylicus]
MRCWKRSLSAFVAAFCAWLLCFGVAQAADISLRNPQLELTDDGYALSADFNINFNTRLEEVISKGVVLYFVIDFELTRSRWYWFDEVVLRRNRTIQLSYHALTRQYRLSTGSLHQGYATLDEALRVMARVRYWPVIDKGEVRSDKAYQAAVRMRLDLSQMPKTFQVSALSSRDWSLNSDWVRWGFMPAELASLAGDAK